MGPSKLDNTVTTVTQYCFQLWFILSDHFKRNSKSLFQDSLQWLCAPGRVGHSCLLQSKTGVVSTVPSGSESGSLCEQGCAPGHSSVPSPAPDSRTRYEQITFVKKKKNVLRDTCIYPCFRYSANVGGKTQCVCLCACLCLSVSVCVWLKLLMYVPDTWYLLEIYSIILIMLSKEFRRQNLQTLTYLFYNTKNIQKRLLECSTRITI
jgi:hypothetical protein